MSDADLNQKMPPHLSVVLACYNEGPILTESVRRILEVLNATRLSYELIFVDDASRDRTPESIRALISRYGDRAPMRALFHERNTGRGGAVCDGFRMAEGAIIGFLDVDLEIPAHYLLPCCLAIHEGSDAAVARRVYKFSWRSLDRYLMSRGYAWLVRRALTLDGVTDTEAGFKFFRRERLLPLLSRCRDTGWFWDTEIMALAHAAGLSIAEVPCLLTRRFDKVSSVRPFHDSLEYLVKLWRFRGRLKAAAVASPVVLHPPTEGTLPVTAGGMGTRVLAKREAMESHPSGWGDP